MKIQTFFAGAILLFSAVLNLQAASEDIPPEADLIDTEYSEKINYIPTAKEKQELEILQNSIYGQIEKDYVARDIEDKIFQWLQNKLSTCDEKFLPDNKDASQIFTRAFFNQNPSVSTEKIAEDQVSIIKKQYREQCSGSSGRAALEKKYHLYKLGDEVEFLSHGLTVRGILGAVYANQIRVNCRIFHRMDMPLKSAGRFWQQEHDQLIRKQMRLQQNRHDISFDKFMEEQKVLHLPPIYIKNHYLPKPIQKEFHFDNTNPQRWISGKQLFASIVRHWKNSQKDNRLTNAGYVFTRKYGWLSSTRHQQLNRDIRLILKQEETAKQQTLAAEEKAAGICPECHGEGTVSMPVGDQSITKECAACKGSGKYEEKMRLANKKRGKGNFLDKIFKNSIGSFSKHVD